MNDWDNQNEYDPCGDAPSVIFVDANVIVVVVVRASDFVYCACVSPLVLLL